MGLDVAVKLLGYLLSSVPELIRVIDAAFSKDPVDDTPIEGKVRVILDDARSKLAASIAKGKAKLGG